jgi:hypothetical protein
MSRIAFVFSVFAPLSFVANAACDEPGSSGGLPCRGFQCPDTISDTTSDTEVAVEETTDVVIDTFVPPACEVGERRCNLGRPQACNNGSWFNEAACQGLDVCEDGACVLRPFYAVIVDDSMIFPNHRTAGTDPCATASAPLYGHGADIDAVGIFDGTMLLGYFDVVDYQEGGICTGTRANTMTDGTQAKGAPDGKIDRGFVSLGGGFVTGEFDAQVRILSGYTIVVYEVGKKCGGNTSCGGVDEGYEVFLAEDLDCVNVGVGHPYTTCAVQLSERSAGEASIPVPAF